MFKLTFTNVSYKKLIVIECS